MGAAALVGKALGFGDRVEAALVASDDEIVLGVEMVVETALGDVQFARDPLHRGAAIAEFVDQPRRRAQELLASRLGLIVFEVDQIGRRSEEHTSELQSLMRISYAVFCLTKTTYTHSQQNTAS